MFEKRKSKRVNLAVSVKCYGFEASTENISDSGISLFSSKPLNVDEMVSLSFFLPSNEYIQVFAKIVWCGKSGKGSYTCGCEFVNTHMKDIAEIKKYIKSMQ